MQRRRLQTATALAPAQPAASNFKAGFRRKFLVDQTPAADLVSLLRVGGDTDAGGNRSRALDEFLAERMAEGYTVEVHEATHAIIVQGGASLLGRLISRRRRRFVVQVDDHGTVSMRPAEAIRH